MTTQIGRCLLQNPPIALGASLKEVARTTLPNPGPALRTWVPRVFENGSRLIKQINPLEQLIVGTHLLAAIRLGDTKALNALAKVEGVGVSLLIADNPWKVAGWTSQYALTFGIYPDLYANWARMLGIAENVRKEGELMTSAIPTLVLLNNGIVVGFKQPVCTQGPAINKWVSGLLNREI